MNHKFLAKQITDASTLCAPREREAIRGYVETVQVAPAAGSSPTKIAP
jgi:hypothetical protein